MKPSPSGDLAAAGIDSRTPGAAAKSGAVQSADRRVLHAAPRLGPFLVLAIQLGLLQLVLTVTRTLGNTEFLKVSAIAFGAFLVHYWLPFRWKEPFWVAVSMAGAFVFLPARAAELLIATGLVFFAILRSRLRYQWRVLAIAAIFGLLAYGAVKTLPHIPTPFYPVFGAIFMFRIIIYIYDLAHSKEPARLLPFLSYFFVLPNYLFALFPVIDFQTMRRTYYQRNGHEIAQQGIFWMTRGTIHLMLYRVVVYYNDAYLPDRISSFGALLASMILTFLLYLNVSGQFHMAIGMLHLFGYDLPETNRKYLLARSMMDLWRRINIYWKDFMVKIVYFPVYFRFRKKGDLRAQVVATAAVFVVTWILHPYQYFWIKGKFEITLPDAIFWTLLGMLIILNVLWDGRHKRSRLPDVSWRGRAIHVAQVLGTFLLITTLWSLWSSPTLGSWTYLMTHWMGGGR